MTHQAQALIVTVGFGTAGDLENTLYQPITKSIRDGDWNLVVLLPSRTTEPNAVEIKRRLPGLTVEISPLPEPGQENDADACFSHFDTVISGLRKRGFNPGDMCVDFTRGTKAMSAAAVLAAVRHDIPLLRYIEGDRDPNRQNNVIPGTERVRQVRPTVAAAKKLLDSARILFSNGDFAAARELLRSVDASSNGLPEVVDFVSKLADLYNGWDRLDYRGAHELANQLPPEPALSAFWDSQWARFAPDETVRAWLAELAAPCPEPLNGQWPRDTCFAMAAHARKLCADLLANGERRIRDRQYEDANLRAYRIAEMLGQIRLFDRGYDSSALDPNDSTVARFQEELQAEKKSLGARETRRKSYYTMSRQNAYRFLKRLGDPFWERLRDLEERNNDADKTIESRNRSILIHGFEPLAIHDEQWLRSTYKKLEQLILQDGGNAAEANLRCARFLNFGFSIE
jgi:CRISPR-associated protein (TIGR02710 family)